MMLASLLLTVAAGDALTAQELAARLRPSVVNLVLSDHNGREIGSGSGFFVSTDGRLVTNHHVIEHAAKVDAELSDGRKVPVDGILAQDPEMDLAIVKVGGTFPALALGDVKSIVVGMPIGTIGNPHGLAGSFSTGVVAALRETGLKDHKGKEVAERKGWRLQHTATSAPGASGSPLVEGQGVVIGVVVGGYSEGAVNFGVPVDAVHALLARVPEDGTVEPFSPVMLDNAWVNLGISAVVLVLVVLGVRATGKKRARGGGRRSDDERRAE